jgi:CubicO group peptidase (beta-lactamase class C family)
MIRCSSSPSKYLLLSLIFLLFTAACTHWSPRVDRHGLPERTYIYQEPEEIDDGWETSSLSMEGLDSSKIRDMIYSIVNKRYKGIHSVLLVKNGKLVLEEYFYGYNRDQLHELHSVSKSITSILVGIAIDRKMIPNVDKQVHEFFPDHTDTRWVDQKYDITLKHVLTMSTGIDWDERSKPLTDSRNDIVAMVFYSDNWIRYVLNKELIEPPGERFNYSGGLNILLGGIIKESSGLYADKFAEGYLFGPLGISDYYWHRHRDGTINTQGGLALRPRDMARIGYVMLRGGNWKGKQIVSQEWIKESTENHISGDYGYGYGYQWRSGKTVINEEPIRTFFAWGRGGQFIFVFPTLDLIAVFTSSIHDNVLVFQPFGIVTKYILPATLPPAPHGEAIKLDSKVLEEYTGRYVSKGDKIDIDIRKGEDTLYFRVGFRERVELFPEARNQFYGSSTLFGDIQANFVRGTGGRIESMVLRLALTTLRFDKIS